MTSSITQTLKDHKISWKRVVELLCDHDADMVERVVTEFISLPAKERPKKVLTDEDKAQKKVISDARAAHKSHFKNVYISEHGGEDHVLHDELTAAIKEEMKTYNKKGNKKEETKKKEAPDESDDEHEEPKEEPKKKEESKEEPKKKTSKKKDEEPKKKDEEPKKKTSKKKTSKKDPGTDSDNSE